MNTSQTKNNQKYPQKDSNLHAIFRGDICIHYIMRANTPLLSQAMEINDIILTAFIESCW